MSAHADHFIDQTKEFGLEQAAKRFYGVYRAYVTSVTDTGKRGCIKVRCPAISSLKELSTPALPVAPFGGQDYGIFFQPAVGEAVYIAFENGCPQNPLYIGGWWGAPGDVSELPIDVQNPVAPFSTKVIKTPIGNGLVFEDDSATKRTELFTGKREEGAISSVKLHRIVLDHTPGSEGIFGETEGKHELLLSDALKRIRLKSTTGFNLLLDDGLKKADLATPLGHLISLNDTTGTITISSVNGNSITLADGGNSITQSTVGGRSFVMDDAGTTISLLDPIGNVVVIGPAGIGMASAAQLALVASGAMTLATVGPLSMLAAGITQVSIGGAPAVAVNTGDALSTTLGSTARTMVGSSTFTLAGALTMAVAGLITMTLSGAVSIAIGGVLTIVGTSVVFGTVGSTLAKGTALQLIGAHTHLAFSTPSASLAPLLVAGNPLFETTVLKSD